MTHHMTPTEYTSALHALNLTPEQAATWLGIGRSTAYRYLKTGCEGPVVVAIRDRLRWDAAKDALEGQLIAAKVNDEGYGVSHAFCQGVIHTYNAVRDATAAVGVGS